jgi:metal-dependent amidase/aminoacylase/carboxypeptidase family protein
MLGELDALVVAGHPDGDPATGAAHACGHNAQVAALMGAAMVVKGAKPPMTREQYLAFQRGLARREVYEG